MSVVQLAVIAKSAMLATALAFELSITRYSLFALESAASPKADRRLLRDRATSPSTARLSIVETESQLTVKIQTRRGTADDRLRPM